MAAERKRRRWKRIRRAGALYALGLGAAALISGGLIGSTAALFSAETQNANSTFAGGWVDPPGAITATPSGYTMGLSWAPGTHGPVTGQQLYGVDNGNNSNCTGVTYVAIGAGMAAAAASYTDTSRGTASNNGNWFCYQLASTSATSWTAAANQAVQLGLVATSIAWTNVAAGVGTLANTDKLTITFNQQTNLAASGTMRVCARTTGGIRIGATATCSNTVAVNVGVISGVTVGTLRSFNSSTYVTTATAPYTLTITFAGGGNSAITGTSLFTGSNTRTSSLTPTAVLCARAVSACQPTTTGRP